RGRIAGFVDDGPAASGEAPSEPADRPVVTVEVDRLAGVSGLTGVGDEGAPMVVEDHTVRRIRALDLPGEDQVLGSSGAEAAVGVVEPDLVRVSQRQLELVGGHEDGEIVV